MTVGTEVTTGTEITTGTEVATGVGTGIPIGMIITRTTATKTGVGPLQSAGIPGWSFEPGHFPGSFKPKRSLQPDFRNRSALLFAIHLFRPA